MKMTVNGTTKTLELTNDEYESLRYLVNKTLTEDIITDYAEDLVHLSDRDVMELELRRLLDVFAVRQFVGQS